MFGRRATDDTKSATPSGSEPTTAETTDAAGRDATAPKGRPTPSRKEAEAARKQAIRVPRDPKAAKAAEQARDTHEWAARAFRDWAPGELQEAFGK